MRVDARDVLMAVGLALLGIGAGLYDWRLGMVVVGAALVLLALVGAMRGGSRE